jgi:predicted nucleotidyltransferase component of viral defense system
MKATYENQVRLLLAVLPFVAAERCFALKGGTAINLFERDLPRLSVDIDLTYVGFESRDLALATIKAALERIAANIERALPNTHARMVHQSEAGLDVKLHIQRHRTQIKIEVNPTLRGIAFPVRDMTCAKRVQELFETFVRVPVVSSGELFGGKICAALDRQHPRDLFDVSLLLADQGLTPDVRLGMIVALVSHNRPLDELLRPRVKDRTQAFSGEFAGMTFIPFSYDEHLETLSALVAEIHKTLTETDRRFLISFEEGNPDWSLLAAADASRLVGPAWKLENLRRLSADNPAKHSDGIARLKSALAS